MKYTITKNTHTGIQEVLTTVGFRSRESIKLRGFEIVYFERIEAMKQVFELRQQCRIPAIKKTINLNQI